MSDYLTDGVGLVSLVSNVSVGEVRVFDQDAFVIALLQRNLVFLGSAIIRKSSFELTGGFRNETLGAEDWYVVVTLALGGGFAFSPIPLAMHVRHELNYSNDHDRMVGAFCEVRRQILKLSLSSSQRSLVRAGLRAELAYHLELAVGRQDYSEARRRAVAVVRHGSANARASKLLLALLLPDRLLRVIQGALKKG